MKKILLESEMELFLKSKGENLGEGGDFDSTLLFELCEHYGFKSYRLDNELNEKHDTYIFIQE
jgi:hypothetical protein